MTEENNSLNNAVQSEAWTDEAVLRLLVDVTECMYAVRCGWVDALFEHGKYDADNNLVIHAELAAGLANELATEYSGLPVSTKKGLESIAKLVLMVVATHNNKDRGSLIVTH